MTTALATLNELSQLPSTSFAADDAAYNDIAKGGDFLSRLQLFTKGKAIDKGLIRPGNYGVPVSEDEVTDLGPKIDVLVVARRPKAIDMNDKQAIITVYDPNSDEFKRIAAQSLEKESGCMYGPSFLVLERSTGQFMEFFCGSKSSRSEAKKLYPFMPLSATDIKAKGLEGVEPHGPLAATLSSRFVERGSYSWHVPVINKCSTPFTTLPTTAAFVREIERFVNPKAEAMEKVADAPAGKKRAR